MKQIKPGKPVLIIIVTVITLLQSCTPADKTIKADLATKAKSDKDFAGVRFIVDKGIVTINGECATEKSKSTVETTVRGTYGVKDIKNNVKVAPVVIGTDALLKQGVDSILKNYPGVEALTKDSTVTLEGSVSGEQVEKLKGEINSLKPKMLTAQLGSK